MAKPAVSVARKVNDLAGTVADVYLDGLRQYAPRSRQLFLNAAIELLEAHREYISAKIKRLESGRSRAKRPLKRKRVRVRAAG